MHKRLRNAGFVTHSLTLPGHGTTPEDLVGVTAEDWIDAVVTKYREVRDAHPTLHVMGMCMGALLSAVVAEHERHAKGRLVLLAPPIYIDGWATPWYRGLRPLLYGVPGLRKRMKIEEEDPYGIKNEQLRAIVKAKFERGENFHYRWVPLECLRQVDRLRAIVMKAAKKIACPTLVVHAREDELTSLRSANFLVEAIGGGRARMVVLEDSYHMVCVDNDREIVAKNVLEFFGAALPGATSALANDPRMSAAELRAAVDNLLSHLAAADYRRGPRARHPRLRVGAAGRQQDRGRACGQGVRVARRTPARDRRAAVHGVRHAGVQSRCRARPRNARRDTRRQRRSNHKGRCCSPGTRESCSSSAGSPTRSSARTPSSARPIRRRADRPKLSAPSRRRRRRRAR